MCHDGTGLRCERTEVRFWRDAGKRPSQTAQEPRSGTPDQSYPGKSTPLDIAVRSWSPATRKNARRSGSKSGSGRWSHWDEIGWVHYPEIGWSHSDEIRGVQSEEIRGVHSEEILHIGYLIPNPKAVNRCPFQPRIATNLMPRLTEFTATASRSSSSWRKGDARRPRDFSYRFRTSAKAIVTYLI